jgi:hypothetical protein
MDSSFFPGDWPLVITDVGLSCIKISALIVAILVPLMIVTEMIRDSRLLDKLAFFLKPILRFFSLPDEAAFPLMGGFFLGITYGSGLILPFTRDHSIKKKDTVIIFIFLSLCHGMIEDTLVFIAIGANGLYLVAIRVILAMLSVFVVMKVSIRIKPAP